MSATTLAQREEGRMTNLGADQAQGAVLKPVLQPELIELYKSGRNELKCGVFGRLFRSTDSLNS